jgi:hypothetical protein
MVLTLDNLAHRYQCLPSEALDRASTFDLYVLDISAKWHNYQNEKIMNKDAPPKPPVLTERTMLDMVKRAKERDHAKR